jgi:cytochrome c oxidase subunit 2
MRKTITLGLVVLLCFSHSVVRVAAGEKESSVNEKVIKVGNAPPTDAAVREIEVSAKKYEYDPASIEVPVNTLVKIHLKALDREHGFEIKSIKDSCVKFKPNESVTVEFYADKAGEFEFACCKYCGLGHGKMMGKLIVK